MISRRGRYEGAHPTENAPAEPVRRLGTGTRCPRPARKRSNRTPRDSILAGRRPSVSPRFRSLFRGAPMKKPQRPRNAFYAQSGGVTAVINASACGVIETARKHKRQIGKVYAGRNGILGALTEDLIDTSKEIRRRHPRAAAHAGRRIRLGALQAEEVRGQPGAVRAPDRSLQGARHRLFLLQRRRRFGRHLPQGLAAGREDSAIRSRPSTCRRPSTTTCRSPTAARASARSRSTSPSRFARPASTSPRWPGPRPRCSSWK